MTAPAAAIAPPHRNSYSRPSYTNADSCNSSARDSGSTAREELILAGDQSSRVTGVDWVLPSAGVPVGVRGVERRVESVLLRPGAR